MHHRLLLAAVAAALAGTAVSQSNTVAGLDGKLYDIAAPTVWGRTGAAFPNGQIGFSASNTMCNPGSIVIPWSSAMAENHPKFGFIVARVMGDRIEQISDRSYCKHAFLSLNSNSGPCLPCSNPGTGSVMGVGCGDVYAASNNGDRFWLGPADEIDPWLGTWNHTGSYFDKGDPDVGAPGNNDGVRSLNSTAGFDVVKNRVTIKESELALAGASYFYQIHLIHQGESVNNRADNILSRPVTYTRNATTGAWSAANAGAVLSGTVLSRWTGATVALGGNGVDDGRFAVAVKVTGPVNGLWHYEYAVHNIDNSRGAAALRIPVCPSARVLNLGFRDIDSNALNQWTASVSNGEIAFTAPAGNPMNWNMIFNFRFDSDASPLLGNATLDEARIGTGALQVGIATQVPGTVPNVWLGAGCGTPDVTLSANGVATIPNPGFALNVNTAPNTGVFVFSSFGTSATQLAPTCTQWLDAATISTFGFAFTDANGNVSMPQVIPAGISPITVNFQAASLVTGGPLFGSFNLSNGLGVRIGFTGCP